jgi:hypothetical protein
MTDSESSTSNFHRRLSGIPLRFLLVLAAVEPSSLQAKMGFLLLLVQSIDFAWL